MTLNEHFKSLLPQQKNDLAMVLISSIRIRLLVKPLRDFQCDIVMPLIILDAKIPLCLELRSKRHAK